MAKLNIKALLGAEERAITPNDLFGKAWDSVATTSAAGKPVTTSTALQHSAVWACVRILSEGVSTLPVFATRGKNESSEKAQRPPAWLESPSPAGGMIDILSQVMTSLLLRGNAYLLTPRDATGNVTELMVLDPNAVRVEVSPATRRKIFWVNEQPFTDHDILHIAGMMLPGASKGISPIEFAKESIGLGLAAQEYGARFFGNGALPGGIVEVDDPLSDQAAGLLRRTWNDLHQGSKNAARLAVFAEGAKFKQISIAPEEAQFLETRAFQVSEIARIFGVPPHLIADATGSTSWGSGLAEQDRAYVIHSLRPWVERIEAAFTWLAQSERVSMVGSQKLYVHLSVEGLLRGDWKNQIETFSKGIAAGIYTQNEARAALGLTPVGPEGDVLLSPLNLAPAAAPDAAPIVEEANAA